MTGEATRLEKAGQLAEARIKYAESQALIEVKEVTEGLKRLDEEIHKRVNAALNESRKLYELHNFKEAATLLDDGMKLQAFQPQLSYNLALCYYQLGDRNTALDYLGKAKAGIAEPKQKQKLLQLLTFFTTGENGLSVSDNDRDRIIRVNRLAESVGLEASLEDDGGAEEAFSEPGTPSVQATPMPLKTNRPPVTHSDANAGHRSSLCNALSELKTTLASRPSATFNLANCAETNGRTAEAVRLLEKYLEMAPTALDGGESRARIADLKSLLTLPGQSGIEIRRLYASAYGALAERKYDRALSDLTKAGTIAPDFPLTLWKLGLLYEAMGDVDQATKNFTRYQRVDV
jgi:tetratricopeptide (TPR) repeat protein